MFSNRRIVPSTAIVNYPKVVLLAPRTPEMYFFRIGTKSLAGLHTCTRNGPSRISGFHRKRGCVMYCELCQSDSQTEFTAEMMIHFSGLPHIDNPGVRAFPKIAVCLDCGFSRFSIAEPELSLLAEVDIPISEPVGR